MNIRIIKPTAGQKLLQKMLYCVSCAGDISEIIALVEIRVL